MSVINEDYFSQIQTKISDIRGIPVYGTVIEPGYSQIRNRAALIFALEVVLHQHREEFGTDWSPLKGKQALEHLLLKKYNWPLREVRDLQLCDIVLLLQDELSPEKLPENAHQILKMYNVLAVRHSFNDFLEEEWDPELYLTIPKQRNW